MLKKIIWFLSIMFLGISVKAITPVVDYSVFDGIYSNRIGDKLFSGKMALITMDGKIVYCLEPFELVGKTYYEDINYYNSISKENLIYYELISYYGYNNLYRNDRYYYMAAQELIWERIIGPDKVYWTTGINGTGNRIDISNYKREILNNINDLYMKPSIDSLEYKIDYFDILKIYDTNNVLDKYSYTFNGDSIIKKENNSFVVEMLDEEKKEINLFRQINDNQRTIIYTGKGNQTLGLFGINMSQSSKFYIKNNDNYNTKLTITFYDKNTNKKLNNIDFTICGENQLLNNWNYENNSYIYQGKVYEGNYSICLLNDYKSDNLDFVINKDIDKRNTNIDIYLTKGIPPKNEESNDINDDISDKEENSDIKNEEIIIFKKTLPNTSNIFLKYYTLLFITLIVGIVFYEKNIRN